ncbi:MAG TPA: AraC family transcriptional regulator [Gemmatimonadales bacterium]|nr:AraC family transcriptional regulator [Gemmatimonadales bacterium]
MFLRHEGFRRLCSARDALKDYYDPPSIAELAREVGISPYHFIRQFEAVFGITPHQYRIRVRLDRARTLLATGYSVTRVCMEVGFTSLGSFSALFSRRGGEPPSNYRRRVLRLPPDRRDLHLTPGCLSLLGHLPAATRHEVGRNFEEAGDRPRV